MAPTAAAATAAAAAAAPAVVAVRKNAKIDGLRSMLEEMFNDEKVNTISLARFKKECVAAWNKAHPEGMAPKSNAYTDFVKNNIARIRVENPKLTHQEHMALLGEAWKIEKQTSATKSSSDEDDESESDTEQEPVPEPEPVPTPAPKPTKAKAAKAAAK